MHDRLRFLVALVLVVAGCGGGVPEVDDASRPKALRISPGVLVKDTIQSGSDPVDWKDFSYYQDVRATVVFSFGDRFTPHNVQGEISLYDFDGNSLQTQRIVPGTVDYPFTFDARKDKDYFFRVEVRKGKAAYMVETRVEPLDPCAACEPGAACCPPVGCCPAGMACAKGTCVPAECSPPCRRGQVCEMGRCEEACPGGCGRGKVCDVEERRCIAVETSRPQPPPRTDPRPRRCQPPCASGETCNLDTLQCEGASSGVSGTVLGVVEEGNGVVIIINRGTEDGVRRGAQGRVAGQSFTVREVSATRCKAFLKVQPSQVPLKSRVTIDR